MVLLSIVSNLCLSFFQKLVVSILDLVSYPKMEERNMKEYLWAFFLWLALWGLIFSVERLPIETNRAPVPKGPDKEFRASPPVCLPRRLNTFRFRPGRRAGDQWSGGGEDLSFGWVG